jgi:hypothetical protein
MTYIIKNWSNKWAVDFNANKTVKVDFTRKNNHSPEIQFGHGDKIINHPQQLYATSLVTPIGLNCTLGKVHRCTMGQHPIIKSQQCNYICTMGQYPKIKFKTMYYNRSIDHYSMTLILKSKTQIACVNIQYFKYLYKCAICATSS